jgi:GLPGLI family protein
MKNLLFSLFLISASTLTTFAQLTEGHVSYKIDITTDNPDMQMVVGMMQGSTMEMYFKPKATRTEVKMGTMMTMTTITNETSGDILTLMSGMMGQNAMKSTVSEIEKKNAEAAKPEVTFVDETKVIEGYTCKKAIVTTEEGMVTVFWYTTEIDVAKKGQSYLNSDVPGFPMQFELNNQGMIMTMTVTKIETKLDKKAESLFDMKIPAGYKEMTMEQMMQMSGGM